MKNCLNILEAHSGLSAKIVEETGFDGIWSSSLCDSASRCLPDTELVTLDERLNTIQEMRNVTDLPIVMDCDTGGATEHLYYRIKKLERAGVDYFVIEDKAFPKRNSLDKNAKHKLEDVDIFADKLMAAKDAVRDAKIIARVESLIAKKSLYEALLRSEAYLNAGADGILIHSKQKVDATEVMEFAKEYKKKWNKPLVAIPTTYQLPKNHPFDMIIYANHLLRASLRAMKETAKTLKTDNIATVKEIFNITGYGK